MKIDRSNYEVWFIDWLDGNLNSYQISELYNFLDLNPDLKEEFNDLSNIPLVTPENQFQFKNSLKRSAEEISESQFEYLSAAYLENDLSDSQKTELDEIIAKDPQKRRVFELINMTHLSPTDIKYKYKKRLLKTTSAQKIFRMSVIGLSSAAAILLIIATYISIPRNLPINNKNEAAVIASDSNLQNSSNDKTADLPEPTNKIQNVVVKNSEVNSPINKTSDLFADLTDNNIEHSSERNLSEPVIEKIKVVEFSGLIHIAINNDLATPFIFLPEEEPENDRSKIGKYLAKTFREKFLKEKTPQDSPLKGYEIAEAGVTGINKLFGWEMALDKKSDQNGNLKSVYFSSRIIKFTAPVKKSEPLP